jgi:hypothetical protein
MAKSKQYMLLCCVEREIFPLGKGTLKEMQALMEKSCDEAGNAECYVRTSMQAWKTRAGVTHYNYDWKIIPVDFEENDHE